MQTLIFQSAGEKQKFAAQHAISVIKELRLRYHIGLKEAKDLFDSWHESNELTFSEEKIAELIKQTENAHDGSSQSKDQSVAHFLGESDTIPQSNKPVFTIKRIFLVVFSIALLVGLFRAPDQTISLLITIGFFYLLIQIAAGMERTKEKRRERIKEIFNTQSNFDNTLTTVTYISRNGKFGIAADTQQKKVCYIDHPDSCPPARIIECKNITSVDLYPNGLAGFQLPTSGDVIGGAALGGAFFGGAGAIVGKNLAQPALKSVDLVLTLKDTAPIVINFLEEKTDVGSAAHKATIENAMAWQNRIKGCL